MLFGAGFAVGAAGLASVFAHEHAAEVDLEELQKRVAELEASPSRTLEQNDELVALYAGWAIALYDSEEGELDDIIGLFTNAEAILQETLAQGDDDVARKQLGNVYLECATVYNGFDELTSVVDLYLKAISTLQPLDEASDGDAKYDIANAKLHLGIAYRELGELEKAKTVLDESFIAYRTVEKISDDDTRICMAAVSVQQGHVLHEMGEESGQVIDAYNRAMRLYVEIIEDQAMVELERNLANVLLDRCMVMYEAWSEQNFDTEEERNQKIEDILTDISRGIELLQKQYEEGNAIARLDLFHGVTLQGKILCDAALYAEAKQSLDQTINDFADLCDGDDDMFLMQMTMAYATRAVVHLGLGDKKQSEADCLKGSELVNKLLQADSSDEDVQELKEQFQLLLEQLK